MTPNETAAGIEVKLADETYSTLSNHRDGKVVYKTNGAQTIIAIEGFNFGEKPHARAHDVFVEAINSAIRNYDRISEVLDGLKNGDSSALENMLKSLKR